MLNLHIHHLRLRFAAFGIFDSVKHVRNYSINEFSELDYSSARRISLETGLVLSSEIQSHNMSKDEESHMLPPSRWFPAWLILEPWRWKQNFPPKVLLIFQGVYCWLKMHVGNVDLADTKHLLKLKHTMNGLHNILLETTKYVLFVYGLSIFHVYLFFEKNLHSSHYFSWLRYVLCLCVGEILYCGVLSCDTM
jgi:hypothetical protein